MKGETRGAAAEAAAAVMVRAAGSEVVVNVVVAKSMQQLYLLTKAMPPKHDSRNILRAPRRIS